MPYGDGASFSGLREEPWPAPGNKKLYFRGWKNLEATLDYAFQKLGMNNARQVVLTGGSAGGLSTFLHADYVAARVSKGGPNGIYKGNACSWLLFGSQKFCRNFAVIPKLDEVHLSYAKFEDSRPEPATVLKSFQALPYFCFMSPHMNTFIETPFYVLNSKYDQWQMDNILQVECIREKKPCSAAEKKQSSRMANRS